MRVFVTGASGFVGSAAAASDGVIHLAYRDGEPSEAAAATDRQVIETLGDALTGSGRPLVVASASSAATRSLLAREPACPGLLDDLSHGEFVQGAQR